VSGYFLSRAADLDVDQLYEFGLSEWGERQADSYLHSLFGLFEVLGRSPGMGRRRPELHDGLRSFPHDSHVVIYAPLAREAAIVRVMHGSADLRRVFVGYDPITALKR
jgi:toxin ParE1/3/4